MIRHLSSEQLSAYLDGEVASPESREIEGHLASCGDCRDRFKSMQRTVSGVWRLERAAPPPGLSTRVRAEVAAVRRPEVFPGRGLVSYVFGLPNRPVLRTSAAMGLALVLSLFLFTNGLEHRTGLQETLVPAPAMPAMVEVVTVEPMVDVPFFLPQTTSKVAGREFVWRELRSGDVWVQRGLEGQEPATHVSAQSPQGRELLARYSELGLLLADGARVVLRYRLETVELSSKGV
ncbi:MAG TPA: zf-HC2 domain-containing protein [Thermoanaerobaculia bacterium]|nr:zf-HC2 domain-containing protein [Thermoanaerobaculia bacterium]